MRHIPLILLSVSLNAAAQMFMRTGMKRIGEVPLEVPALVKAAPQMLVNLWLWTALASYGVSVVLWMVVLSKVEVSFAYAFLSLGFVMVTVLGFLLFQENVTWVRALGIALICAGVFFVAHSGKTL
ncbi:MAG: EamA family transporter [Puniceicoccales bacterium]|jgi:multidrug transporter EmrE-like cation transporter|nr:EamA family transporter [Puniceicoccales bacterium]